MSRTKKADTAAEDRLDFKRIFPIFVIVLVDLMGVTVIIPVLPFYAAAFGADAFMIGLLQSVYPFMQLVGAPILGGLSDRYGRKPVLVVSQIGTFSGFLVLGFAVTFPVLILSRFIDGISGANIAVAQAALADSTTEKTRAQGLGLIGAAFGLGFIIGPVIAFVALALSGNNYQVPAFVAAGLSLISILLTIFWFEETLPQPGDNRERAEHKPRDLSPRAIITGLMHPLIGSLLVLMFFQQLARGGFQSLLALFTLSRLGLNAAANSMLFVLIGVILVIVQGRYIGPWSRRYGERRLIYVGVALLGFSLLLTGLTPAQPPPWYSQADLQAELSTDGTTTSGAMDVSIALPDEGGEGWFGISWLLLAMIPAGIGGGLIKPCIDSLITKRVPSEDVGQALGVSAGLYSLANAVTPFAGGALFQIIDPGAPFLAGAVVMLLMWFFAMWRITAGPEEAMSDADDDMELEPLTASGD